MTRLITDEILKRGLMQAGCNNFWIIKVFGHKPKKPIDVMYHQSHGNIMDALDEMFDAMRRLGYAEKLEAVTVEARRMTEAEIAKWDHEAAKREKDDEHNIID